MFNLQTRASLVDEEVKTYLVVRRCAVIAAINCRSASRHRATKCINS